MTKRFLKDDIHELMMKTSTDYAISEKYGLHDTLDALEGVVKNRNSPNSNYSYKRFPFIKTETEEKRDHLKRFHNNSFTDRQIYDNMSDSEIEREYDRRERQEKLRIMKACLQSKGYSTGYIDCMSPSELELTVSREKEKERKKIKNKKKTK